MSAKAGCATDARRKSVLRATRIALGILFATLTVASVVSFSAPVVKIGDAAPDIKGTPWINGQPLTLTDLRGKVVLIDFWTYG